MFNWMKNHKAYVTAIVFFILAMVFNEPEDPVNGVAMLLFMVSILFGFVGFIKTCENDSKSYFGEK